MALEQVDKLLETVVKAEPEQRVIKEVNEPETAKNEPIPEKPVKSALASKYLRLADIYDKLEKQNSAIYQREQQLVELEKEIAGLKGIFKGKQRKQLQEQAEQLRLQIANMKRHLPNIVQDYGYKNVKDFLAEYSDYQLAVAKWEK